MIKLWCWWWWMSLMYRKTRPVKKIWSICALWCTWSPKMWFFSIIFRQEWGSGSGWGAGRALDGSYDTRRPALVEAIKDSRICPLSQITSTSLARGGIGVSYFRTTDKCIRGKNQMFAHGWYYHGMVHGPWYHANMVWEKTLSNEVASGADAGGFTGMWQLGDVFQFYCGWSHLWLWYQNWLYQGDARLVNWFSSSPDWSFNSLLLFAM